MPLGRLPYTWIGKLRFKMEYSSLRLEINSYENYYNENTQGRFRRKNAAQQRAYIYVFQTSAPKEREQHVRGENNHEEDKRCGRESLCAYPDRFGQHQYKHAYAGCGTHYKNAFPAQSALGSIHRNKYKNRPKEIICKAAGNGTNESSEIFQEYVSKFITAEFRNCPDNQRPKTRHHAGGGLKTCCYSGIGPNSRMQEIIIPNAITDKSADGNSTGDHLINQPQIHIACGI